MLFSESTGLYLYSSLIQANAAIIAVIAFFLSFKLEKLKSLIQETKLQIPTTWSTGYSSQLMSEFEKAGLIQKKQILDRLELDHKNSNTTLPNSKTMEYYRNWFRISNKIKEIETSIYHPLFLLISSVVLYSVFLIFSFSLHLILNNYELIVFTIVIAFEIYILKQVLNLAGNALIEKIDD
jgi:hypothetical protein